MTTREWAPWPNDLHIRTWPVIPGDTPDVQGFRKLSSDRHTDRQVIRSHVRSRDKDGGHTVRSALFKNPILHANFVALSFIEPELLAIKVYIAGIGNLDVFGSCDLDLDPMTFVYEFYPYCLEIFRMCKRWTSYVTTFESYPLAYMHTSDRDRQAESTEIIYEWSNKVILHRNILADKQAKYSALTTALTIHTRTIF